MDFEFYLDKFKKSAKGLDKNQLDKKQLEVSVGIVLDSVFLKLYKREWTNDLNNPLNAEARIFFSIWVNEKTIGENKIFYNIHALKLRKLKGYSIISREFADSYRKEFKRHKTNWDNVNVNLGPLTLIEGWKEFNNENIENIIVNLADNFSEIDYLVDNTLKAFKK
jgi:hypothetical protein